MAADSLEALWTWSFVGQDVRVFQKRPDQGLSSAVRTVASTLAHLVLWGIQVVVTRHVMKNVSQTRISCTEDLDITLKHLWMSGGCEWEIPCVPNLGPLSRFSMHVMQNDLQLIIVKYWCSLQDICLMERKITQSIFCSHIKKLNEWSRLWHFQNFLWIRGKIFGNKLCYWQTI